MSSVNALAALHRFQTLSFHSNAPDTAFIFVLESLQLIRENGGTLAIPTVSFWWIEHFSYSIIYRFDSESSSNGGIF